MELNEQLNAEGVDSLDALKEKIRLEEQAKATAAIMEKDAQIAGLETIKTEAAAKLAEAGRTIASLTPEPISKEKETEDEQAAKAQADASLKQANELRSGNLSEEDDAKLVEAYNGLPPEARKLVDTSPEGLSSLMDEVLGSNDTPLQKTFRQPEPQVKLSVTEQIQQALGKLKPQTTPRLRPQGLALSSNTQTQPNIGPAINLLHDGSIFGAIQMKK